MKKLLSSISFVIVCFYSNLVFGNEVADLFVEKFKPDLVREYKYIIDNKRPSKSLPSFVIKTSNYWEKNYNNTPVTLSSEQCAFWLALSEIKGRVRSSFSDDFFDHLNYLYLLLIEDIKIEENHRKVCRVWINENIDTSIIDLKLKGIKFKEKIVSLTGVLYTKESNGLSALFLTREHFQAVDLSNAIVLDNRVNIDPNLHGKLVRIEGRLKIYESEKIDETRSYLYFGRVLQTYD